MVKNCGAPIHQEVIKRSFLEQLKDRIQGQQTDQVGQKILEMIQTWGIAGRSKHEFKLAADLYNIMKVEGYFSINISSYDNSQFLLPFLKSPQSESK